jgi:uncharacterized membrane protein (UPF0127 family)
MGRPAWLLRGAEVLAAAEVLDSPLARVQGLIGKRDLDGVLVLPRTRSVHTVGVRFPIDVVYVDGRMVVLDVVPMAPLRLGRPRMKARAVIEARAGFCDKWSLAPGDQLELRE